MEHARKMVVVPNELFDRLQATSSNEKKHSSNNQSDNSLDVQMQDIMNNRNIDDSEKWKLYKQVLQRFLHIASNNRKPINIPIYDIDGDGDNQQAAAAAEAGPVEEIVETFTKTYRPDVRNLLHFMKRHGSQIRWDDGYSVYYKNQKIANSNIVDILNCIVRVRMIDRIPPGWNQVITALKDMNVPKEYINNSRALSFLDAPYRLVKTNQDVSTFSGSASGSLSTSTPLLQRLRSAKRQKQQQEEEEEEAIGEKSSSSSSSSFDFSRLEKWEQYPTKK